MSNYMAFESYFEMRMNMEVQITQAPLFLRIIQRDLLSIWPSMCYLLMLYYIKPIELDRNF